MSCSEKYKKTDEKIENNTEKMKNNNRIKQKRGAKIGAKYPGG